MLRFEVVTFDSESLNTTDQAALRVYSFDLELPSLPQFHLSDSLCTNTLPSNTSDSCFPGFFHSEPSSRLLALEVEVLRTDFVRVPHILYVPHDVLLGYIRSHPSDSHTVVVPWKAWGHGNAHILASPHPCLNRYEFRGCKIVCGMHAITGKPMVILQGKQRMLRIMDYHPRRIYRNSVTGTQDTHLRSRAADSHKGLDPPGTSARQEATDEDIPYTFKDIPLPGGLRLENIRCVLGEDVVVVFEVGFPSLLMVLYEGTHSVQVFILF
jgi:hypothetical protein